MQWGVELVFWMCEFFSVGVWFRGGGKELKRDNIR